jgi:hypothetical protein
MTKPLFKILTGVIVLIILIYIGVPFEIEDALLDSIFKVLSFGLVFFLLYLLFKQVRKLGNEGLRIGGYVLLGLFSLLFLLGALWNDIWITEKNERNTFYTLEVWTNKSGIKILRQLRETSGSIYDYRDRLVIYEFDANNRISINTNVDNYDGPWTVLNVGEENKNKLGRLE